MENFFLKKPLANPSGFFILKHMAILSKILILFYCVTSSNFLLAYINPPIVISRNKDDYTNKKEVLIYYSNETAPVGRELDNYQQIMTWLETIDTTKSLKILSQLKRDLSEFTEVIDKETSEIKLLFSKLTKNEQKHLVIFTNRLARERLFLSKDARDTEFTQHSISFLSSDNYIIKNNPLATKEGFKEALINVAKLYNPQEHIFILLSKSHGNYTMAFTPRLTLQSENESPNSIRTLIEMESPNNDIDSVQIQDRQHLRIGTTKSEYFSVLEEVGVEKNMLFSLVFMEACKSGMKLDNIRLPTNIHYLYTTEYGTEYSCVQWNKVITNSDSITNGLDTFLRNFSQENSPPNQKLKTYNYWSMLYFLPLLFCLCFIFYKVVRSKEH